MTVASATSRKTFSGDDVTTSFGTSPIVFFETNNLLVYVVTDATGAITTLTEGTDYTVSGGDGSTGTVSLAGGSDPWGALASGTSLVILRELSVVQEFDPEQNDGSDAEALEDAIDRVVMIQQQINEAQGRTLRVAVSESEEDEINVTGKAGYTLRRNVAGTAFELVDGDENSTTFTQSGTGAVERSLVAKVGEMPATPQDFGAVGDGVTDDTAAFEKMLASGKESFYVPDGTYMLEPVTTRTDPVLGESIRCALMMRSNQRLVMSPNAKLKQIAWQGAGQANDDSGWMIVTLGVDNVHIEGGILEGNWEFSGSYPSRDASTQHGIHVASSTNVFVRGVKMLGWWGDCWTVSYYGDQANCDNSKNVSFIDCYCTDNRRNGGSAVGVVGMSVIGGKYADTLGTSPFGGIDLEANVVSGLAGGAGLSYVKNVRIQGVHTTGNKYGIYVSTSTLGRCEDVTVTGCTIDDGLLFSVARYCNVIGNVIQNPQNDPDTAAALSGIRFIDSDHCVASGNIIHNCNRHGIEVDANSDHNSVIGNHIRDCSQHTDATYSGIYVAGRFTHVGGGKIHRGVGAKQNKYGIEIVASATSTHLGNPFLYQAGKTANYSDGSASVEGFYADDGHGGIIIDPASTIKFGQSDTTATNGTGEAMKANVEGYLQVTTPAGANVKIPFVKT